MPSMQLFLSLHAARGQCSLNSLTTLPTEHWKPKNSKLKFQHDRLLLKCGLVRTNRYILKEIKSDYEGCLLLVEKMELEMESLKEKVQKAKDQEQAVEHNTIVQEKIKSFKVTRDSLRDEIEDVTNDIMSVNSDINLAENTIVSWQYLAVCSSWRAALLDRGCCVGWARIPGEPWI